MCQPKRNSSKTCGRQIQRKRRTYSETNGALCKNKPTEKEYLPKDTAINRERI